MKRLEIRICGVGGQGIILIGQIIGMAASYSGRNAVQTPSYGAEARGTESKSELIISDGKIGFPFVRSCDILVGMDKDVTEKNVGDLKEDGILIIDSKINLHLTKGKVIKVPATEIAEKEFGQKLYANMIILGVLAKILGINEKYVKKAIKDAVPEKFVEANFHAYRIGRKLKV